MQQIFKIMKKIILIALFAMTSCSKSEDAVSTEKALDIAYKSPELDFYAIPNKSLTNIQVGDMIKVNLEISKLKGADIIEIKPTSKATAFHELLNTDYELYIPSATEKGMFTKVTSVMMKLGTNVFYVKPLVPGTFQINLEEATKAYEIIAPVVFSAVKIKTRIQGNMDGQCGGSKWWRHTYWFSIDSGNQTYDLLFNEKGATYTYETSYKSASKTANFVPGTESRIIEDASQCGGYPAVDNVVKSIAITKTIAGNKQIIAIYYNIPISN